MKFGLESLNNPHDQLHIGVAVRSTGKLRPPPTSQPSGAWVVGARSATTARIIQLSGPNLHAPH